MELDYALIENLEDLIESIQPDSIVSRTFYKDERLKAILFGFDTGQELSEHTSSQAAIIQIVKGEATVTLGEDRHELQTGAWVYMPPRLKHSVYAKTPLTILLMMLGSD
ncbi:MAG: cupin domain-containing protein [Anaerolineae bacterium]|nr:cupin domain-containing protein [Anaerolineae bacterium]